MYEPALAELYVGVAGGGAYRNGERLRADGRKALGQAMVLTDVGYERSPLGVARLSAAYAALLTAGVRALRIVGSTVLSVCSEPS